jgi:predicted phosphodiesterase
MASENDKILSAYASDNGYDETAKKFNITKESVRRACRRVKQTEGGLSFSDSAIIKKLHEQFSDEEIPFLLNGKLLNPEQNSYPSLSFDCDEVSVGYITDTHIGSIYFEDYLWNSFIAECNKQHVKCILHSGDITEGMCNRPDQIYSLEDIGFTAQMDHVERLFKQTDLTIYGIDGNHDRWGIKSGGLYIGRELEKRIPNFKFLGHDNADIYINDTCWKLWHGEDGASYATSYRIQKIIDTLPYNHMPAVLLCGHTHKEISMYDRGIYAVSGGALSFQTAYMQSKRLDAHTGFHILKAGIKNGKILYFCPVWYPIERIK